MNVGSCALRRVPTCSAKDSVADVAKMLRDGKERHAVVLKNKRPVGIISVVDIAYRLVAEDRDASDTLAENIMSASLLVKESSDMLTPVYIEMVKANVYGCVITKGERVLGMLDLKEAMNCLVKAKSNHGNRSKNS